MAAKNEQQKNSLKMREKLTGMLYELFTRKGKAPTPPAPKPNQINLQVSLATKTFSRHACGVKKRFCKFSSLRLPVYTVLSNPIDLRQDQVRLRVGVSVHPPHAVACSFEFQILALHCSGTRKYVLLLEMCQAFFEKTTHLF